MKNNISMIKAIKVLALIVLIFIISNESLLAQISHPSNGTDPDSAPVDGGLSLLIAGGVGYGIKKIREKRNNKSI